MKRSILILLILLLVIISLLYSHVSIYAESTDSCINPSITTQPESLARNPGTPVEFTVTATGNSLSYQWKKDGLNIPEATSSTYSIASPNLTHTGNYTVEVRSTCVSPVTSSTAVLTIANYFVATNGNDNNPGTFTQPFATWQKGFNTLIAGQTLCIRGGTYYPTATVAQSRYCGVAVDNRDGTSASWFTVVAYPGETPVLDCRNMTGTSYDKYGIMISGSDYWHLKGLEVTRVDQITTGAHGAMGIMVRAYGSNVLIENCVAHHNGGPGMGSNIPGTEIHFLNCDAYLNFDEFTVVTPGEHADGFDIGYSYGNPVIRLTGCRSWNNGDDGFDMYQGSTYSGIYYLKDCWTWHNGYWPDGTTAGGNGCGFKYGRDDQPWDGVTRRYSYNCIAYDNRKRGYSQETCLTKKEFYNCISHSNNTWGWSFYGYDVEDVLHNNIAFGDGVEQIGINRISDHNSWDGGVIVTAADFVSIDASELDNARQPDGSLPIISYLHLDLSSDLIDFGVDVGLPFSGDKPDLGAFEYSDGSPDVGINQQKDSPIITDKKDLFVVYPNPVKDDLTIALDDDDIKVSLKLYDLKGMKLYERIAAGTTTIDMSSYSSGLYIMHVEIRGKLKVTKIIK